MLKDTLYLCFPASTPRQHALARYIERYGAAPTQTEVELGLLWVGPVPQTGDKTTELIRD